MISPTTIRLLFFFAAAWLAHVTCLRAEETAPARPIPAGTQDRSYAEVDQRLYNSTFISWLGGGGNMISRRAFSDPEDIRKRAEYLKSLGIRGIELGGMHFRLGWSGEWDMINKITAEITKACRENGIIVIEHHDFPLPFYNAYPILAANTDWLQRDVRTGEPFAWFDPINPGWLGAYTQYLLDMQEAARPDGYMLDEVTLSTWYASASDDSRHTVREWTGRPEPVWADMVNPNLDDPNYSSWIHWRSLVEPAAMAHLFGELRKRQPGTISMAYSAGYTTPGNIYDLTNTAANFSNFVGYECIVADPLQGWQGMMRELIERGSLKDYFHIPVWVLLRQVRTADQLYFAWAMSHMTRHSTWLGPLATENPEVLASVAKYADWQAAMPHQHARTLTDTAVLLSHQARRVSADPDFFLNDFGGWNSALIEENIPFDVLLDGDLEKPGRLGKYRTLILASQACLSEAQVRNLTEWVKAGGTCIFTRNTSLHDEWGTPREDFALGEAANLGLARRGRRDLTISANVGGREFEIPDVSVPFEVRLRDPAKSEVLATTKREDREVPIAWETAFGQGRMIYIGADLGATQFQREVKHSQSYRGDGRGDVRDFIRAVLERTRRNAPPPAALELPEGVVGTIFQLVDGPDKGAVYVHLLNVGGKTLRAGDKIGEGMRLDMPPVTERMDIRLNFPVLGSAILDSPRQTEPRKIEPVMLADGTAILEVPGAAINDYLQIRIPAELWHRIQPPPVPMGTGINLPLGEEVSSLPKASWVPQPPALDEFVPSPPEASVFSFGASGLPLRLKGTPIVTGEFAMGFEPNKLTPVSGTEFELNSTSPLALAAGGWNANVASGQSRTGILWTRELAVRGNDAEITASFRIPRRDNGAEFLALVHEILVPVSTLRGATYEARVGLHRVPDPNRSGRLTGEEPDGVQILRYARTIQFEGAAKDFLIDFNPCGPWGVFWDDPSSSFHAHLVRRGENYVFQIEVPWARYGADVNSKVVLRAGKHRLDELHPVRSTHYAISLPASRRIQFTDGSTAGGFTQYAARGFGFDKGFQGWALQPYNPGRGAGWKAVAPAAKVIKADANAPLGPIYSGGIHSQGEAHFAVAHPNAFVLVNLLFASAEGAEPAEVSVDGRPWKTIEIDPARRRTTLTFPLVLRDGEIDIRMRGGPWKLSGLVIQPLLYAQEDYSFERSWWALGRAPWLLPGFPDAAKWNDFDTTSFGPQSLEQIINQPLSHSPKTNQP